VLASKLEQFHKLKYVPSNSDLLRVQLSPAAENGGCFPKGFKTKDVFLVVEDCGIMHMHSPRGRVAMETKTNISVITFRLICSFQDVDFLLNLYLFSYW